MQATLKKTFKADYIIFSVPIIDRADKHTVKGKKTTGVGSKGLDAGSSDILSTSFHDLNISHQAF